MRTVIWLACVSALLVVAKSARAAGQGPAWAAGCVRVSRDSFAKDSRVPAGYDASEIEKLLFPEAMVVSEERVEVPWLLFVKPWRASPGLSVAVLETVTYRKDGPMGGNDESTTLYIAVFAGGTGGAKVDIKARGRVVGVAERHVRELDLAPYRLAPDKLAFGVRTWMHWPYAGGGGENSYLSLFAVDGQRVKKVWATLMQSSSMRNDGYSEDGSPNKIEEGCCDGEAIITVLKTKSGGCYDLRKVQGHRAVTCRWNGETYVMKGKDPVENVNGFPEAEVDAE